MKILKNIVLLIVLVFSCNISFAQDDLPTEQVDVIKSFNAILLNTEKVDVAPKLPPLDTSVRRQQYSIISRSLDVDYLPPKIKPLAMKRERLQEAYKGYLKVGAGYPTSFFADGGYNIVANEKVDFGVNLKHHSANNNANVENQRFSFSKIGVDGTVYMDQGYAINGKIGYSRNNIFFYSYNDFNSADTTLSFAADDVRQQFNTFDFSASIFNGERTEADFNYYAGIDFYRLEDDYAARETGFKLKLNGTKWFDDRHPLSITLLTDFTRYADTARQSLNNFYLMPNYTFHGETFMAKVGANIVSHEDEFSLFPDLELSAKIIESTLSAFVGAGGTLQKNNFQSLSNYSPYVSSRIEVENTSYYHFYGGVKGNIQGMDYRVQANYKTADDLALFQSNQDTLTRFNVVYDTATIITVQGTLSAPIFKGFEVTGTVASHIYSLNREAEPWHLPSLSLNLGAKYTTMEDQLSLKAELFLENGVPFLNDEGKAENLNALFDISVGAEYFFSEKLGGFIQINNLASNKRERWVNYPTFGINALLGISARF
jgi:hypothetical protein